MFSSKKLFFILIFLFPVCAFPACKGSYADYYCNCRCTLQYKIPADTAECCKYNWGGYGEDGDTNCCAAPKVWVKSRTACLTPCTCPAGQPRNNAVNYSEDGACCQAPGPQILTGTAMVTTTGYINRTAIVVTGQLCTSEGGYTADGRLEGTPCASRSAADCTRVEYFTGDCVDYERVGTCGAHSGYTGGFTCTPANYPECPSGQTDQQICAAKGKGYKCVKSNTLIAPDGKTAWAYDICALKSGKCVDSGPGTRWTWKVTKGTVQYLSCP